MKTKILQKAILVEDSKIIARDLKHHLEIFGYKVIDIFTSGEDFLIAEQNLNYDFVIMDIMLEGKLNGLETVQKLYLSKLKPVLFLTATNDESIIHEAKVLNPLGYLLKPYTPTQLKITFDMAFQKWLTDEELREHKEHLEDLIEERTKELNRAKEDAERSEKLKTAFIHNISHEIRTPLNAIIGFTELLINPKISNSKKNEFIKYIQNSTSSLLTLVDNVWQLSHIQIGQIKPIVTKTYLNEILDAIELELKKLIYESNKQIDVILDKKHQNSDFFVFSDPTIIKRILQNLVYNAVKYTLSGFISVAYEIQDQALFIYIEDSGMGISEKNLSNIFDVFYKVESSKNELFRGAGLGLALTKSLVELLKGKISVESELGKGTRFTIRLPLSPSIEKNKNIAFIDIPFDIKNENFISSQNMNFQYFQSFDEFFNILKTGATFELIVLNTKSEIQGKKDIMKIRSAIAAKIVCLGNTGFISWLNNEKSLGNIFDFLIKPLDYSKLANILFV